jgi:hypothetical protein
MKNYKAWMFLVSRNQYLDYRTVVAPDFICKEGVSSILARQVNGDINEKCSPSYCKIPNSTSTVGDLTLAFRVIEAKAEDIEAKAEDTGISGNGVLKDSFGREIYLIEGIVFKGIIDDDDLVTWEDLEKYHEKYLVKKYREFWKDTAYSQVRSSESFDFPDVNDSDANLESITSPAKQWESPQLQPESPTEKSDSLECECTDNPQINGETQSSHQDDQEPRLLKILRCPIFIIFRLLKKLFGK